jgi:hypothetical protein
VLRALAAMSRWALPAYRFVGEEGDSRVVTCVSRLGALVVGANSYEYGAGGRLVIEFTSLASRGVAAVGVIDARYSGSVDTLYDFPFVAVSNTGLVLHQRPTDKSPPAGFTWRQGDTVQAVVDFCSSPITVVFGCGGRLTAPFRLDGFDVRGAIRPMAF